MIGTSEKIMLKGSIAFSGEVDFRFTVENASKQLARLVRLRHEE
jgi:hypothetical protein